MVRVKHLTTPRQQDVLRCCQKPPMFPTREEYPLHRKHCGERERLQTPDLHHLKGTADCWCDSSQQIASFSSTQRCDNSTRMATERRMLRLPVGLHGGDVGHVSQSNCYRSMESLLSLILCQSIIPRLQEKALSIILDMPNQHAAKVHWNKRKEGAHSRLKGWNAFTVHLQISPGTCVPIRGHTCYYIPVQVDSGGVFQAWRLTRSYTTVSESNWSFENEVSETSVSCHGYFLHLCSDERCSVW